MRKILLPLIITIIMLVTAACGNNNSDNATPVVEEAATNAVEDTKEVEAEVDAATAEPALVTYESETGPIEVPVNPQRVVVLASSYAGNVMALGVPIAGTDSWAHGSSLYKDYLKDAALISEEDVEGVLNLEPDLIIAAPTTQNLEKFKEIAPTIIYTYNALDFLAQHIEIGKLLGKEMEAKAWVDDFKARAEQAGIDAKAKHGEDVTVTVVESYAKEMAVFGNNWGRGTEVLYQEMGIGMPEKVKEMALKDGYYSLSLEVLPEFSGDFIVLSNDGTDNSFKETETYKNIPAVANNRVIEANAADFFFNDPITLDFQLNLFIDGFSK